MLVLVLCLIPRPMAQLTHTRLCLTTVLEVWLSNTRWLSMKKPLKDSSQGLSGR